MERKQISADVYKNAVIGLVLICIVLAGLLAYKFFSDRILKSKEVFLPNSSVQVVSAKDAFPREYVLEDGALLLEPDLLDYESGERLWRASYISQMDVSEALNIYEFYFNLNGWQITNSGKSGDNSFMFAQAEGRQITLSADKTPIGTRVAITILER